MADHPLPQRRIQFLHGQTGQMTWHHSQAQAIDHLSRQLFQYYFQKDGRAVRLVLDRLDDGEIFLKAETDGKVPQALLQLPTYNPNSPPNFHAMNELSNLSDEPKQITTLVDHQRDGQFVFAFCPICDHAVESKDDGEGRDHAATASIAKIRLHIQKSHRPKPAKVKINFLQRR